MVYVGSSFYANITYSIMKKGVIIMFKKKRVCNNWL